MRKEGQKLPEGFVPNDKTQFSIIPGRYYATMFFVRLPEQDNEDLRMGGDVNALVWRNAETPNEWTLQWRFRYYRSRDAWQSGDKKVWYGGKVTGSEDEVVSGFESVMNALGAAAGFPVERLDIHGDCERFFQAVKEQSPSWLHLGLHDEEANKGGIADRN